jgi:AcrR family transcriptional regulator
MATDLDAGGRANQRRRTRKDLLNAAAGLLRAGRKPSLEEIAEAAMVSRATAYRYFPNVEALLLEATLDLATPDVETLFGPGAPADPVERLRMADAALDEMIAGNELALRMMLAGAVERGYRPEGAAGAPVRQNRRSALIEAALAPSRDSFAPADLKRLKAILAVIIGTEGMVVFKDVLQIDMQEARAVKRWAIAALVAAARKRQA